MRNSNFLFVNFDNMNEALKMEAQAKKLGIPGRLVPNANSGSPCGLSWRSPNLYRAQIEDLSRQGRIRIRSIS